MRYSSFFPARHADLVRELDACYGTAHVPAIAPGTPWQRYPDPPIEDDADVYDTVICGAGTAGCVLASRLSEDPAAKVLLLERGPLVLDDLLSRNPFLSALRLHLGLYATGWPVEQQEQLTAGKDGKDGKQRPPVWVGNLVGGGSACNVGLYTRGSYAEFDGWGMPGWSGRELRPYFDRSERHHSDRPARSGHGSDGPWHTRTGEPIFGLSEPFLQAATQLGVPRVEDPHADTAGQEDGPVATGSFLVQLAQKSDGTRHSTAQAYLFDGDVLQKRSAEGRLHLATGVAVDHVQLSKDADGVLRAKGLWVCSNGRCYYIRARRVILSAGAVFSPCILQRSGVGPASLLPTGDEPSMPRLLLRSDGVGARLQDHACTLLHFRVPAHNSLLPALRPTTALKHLVSGTWQYLRRGRGWMTTAMGVETMLYLSTDDVHASDSGVRVTCADVRGAAPDIEISMGSMYADQAMPTYYGTTDAKHGVASFLVYLAKPRSHGRVQIRSADPHEDGRRGLLGGKGGPLVDPRLLTHEDDRRRLTLGVRFAMALAAAMRHEHGLDIGPACVPGWDSRQGGWSPSASMLAPSPFERAWDFCDANSLPDSTIEEFISRETMCVQHMSGTCGMGDEGVVDPADLHIHGTRGLHVCDASVFPILAVHPQAAVAAVAEKVSDTLRAM